jgi:hypothetical protein
MPWRTCPGTSPSETLARPSPAAATAAPPIPSPTPGPGVAPTVAAPAAAAVTITLAPPLIEPLALSVAVTDWAPVVFKVTPLVKV